MDNKSITKMALDVYRGTVPTEYADKDMAAILRQTLIDLNGGSTKLDYKTLRRNKGEIFEIIEEIIPIMVQEGLKGDEFFLNFVEQKNLKAGDKNEFIVPSNTTFVVSEIANGISTPRRQRIGRKTTLAIPVFTHTIRFYDELRRYLAGRIDWNEFIDYAVRSYKAAVYNDVYTAFAGIAANTNNLSETYVPTAGGYSEAALLELVEHVEAANDKNAIIFGTKAALRKCKTAVEADEARSDYYNVGHYGKLAGVDMIGLKNRHKVGSEEFILPDNKLWVVAGDDKFIKQVFEGEAFILDKDGTVNADQTMEYLYTEAWGTAVILSEKIGVYTIA